MEEKQVENPQKPKTPDYSKIPDATFDDFLDQVVNIGASEPENTRIYKSGGSSTRNTTGGVIKSSGTGSKNNSDGKPTVSSSDQVVEKIDVIHSSFYAVQQLSQRSHEQQQKQQQQSFLQHVVDDKKSKIAITNSVTTPTELVAELNDINSKTEKKEENNSIKINQDSNNIILASDIPVFNDAASVFSDASRYTGFVSSVGSLEYQLNDALVAIVGVGEYYGLPNLDGVVKDYENVIKTFCIYWKYNVLFQLNNNKYIYSNDIDELKMNANKDYKLKWNGDDIDNFVEESRKHLVKNKHNGLILIISSHGDRDKIMYDSDCEKYELDAIFCMYQPNAASLVESYNETAQESNYLSQIPKIFVLDMCRGDLRAKPVKTQSKTNTKTKSNAELTANDEDDITKHKTQKEKTDETPEEKQDDKQDDSNNIHETPSAQQGITNVNNIFTSYNDDSKCNSNQNEQENANAKKSGFEVQNTSEKFSFKGIGKDTAAKIATNASNFLKIYGTPEGYAVADGAAKGGLFLRNFCMVFKDRDFVSKHYLSDIILKIREYTKREATILSNIVEFTQLVETEGTLEKNVKILSKMSHFHFNQQSGFYLASYHNHHYDFLSSNNKENEYYSHVEYESVNEQISRKLLITNLSNCEKIAVLTEYEDSSENKEDMLNALASDDSKENNLFLKHNFVIIEPNGGKHEFNKPYSDSLFITMFVIDNNNDNREIFDGFESKEDYLYFENDSLSRLVDFRHKCVENSKHFLTQTRVTRIRDDENNGKCKKCGISAIITGCNDYSFVCRKCKYQLCQNCCHKMITTKYGSNNTSMVNDSNFNDNINYNMNGAMVKEQKDTSKVKFEQQIIKHVYCVPSQILFARYCLFYCPLISMTLETIYQKKHSI